MDALEKNEEGGEEQTLRTPGHPPMEEGLSKKRKIQIVVVLLGALILLVGILFLTGGKQSAKDAKAVLPMNRGLMQAEALRRQKDLFDDKSKDTEADWARKLQALRQTEAPTAAALRDSLANPVPLDSKAGNPFSEDPGTVAEPALPKGSLKNPWRVIPSAVGRPVSSAASPMDAPRTTPEKPMEFKPSEQMAKEMSDIYQKALAYNASEQLVYARNRTDEEGKGKNSPPTRVPGKTVASGKVMVSAGQELTAVLTESLNSDYPSVAKATLTSPAELAGSTVLLSYSLGQERVTAQVVKLILPAKEGERAKEQTLSAVVKSGLPGLTGDVSHHWIPQIASGMANAGLTAGALYYASQNSSKDLGTAVLVAPMIEQSVQGVLKPINYLGRDRPVTVSVPAGTEFTLLVTEGFEVDL